ncbi:Protein of unknown function [Bacillus wiedmannii]|nr:Protein of unknown function [Bacillus wiedmannii]
MFSVCT